VALDVFVMEVEMAVAGARGCNACDTTLSRVRAAADRLRPAFDALGVEIRIEKLMVVSEPQARVLGLRASPMVRIGAIDLVPDHRDRSPDGAQGAWIETDRVWRWRGEEHDQPPVGMLVDAMMRGYAAAPIEPDHPMPAYVRQFLAGSAAETVGRCG
jgi:hypothetical protein